MAFLPWEAWAAAQDPAKGLTTHEHIARSPNCSIAKSERLLDYRPRYTSLEAIADALTALDFRR